MSPCLPRRSGRRGRKLLVAGILLAAIGAGSYYGYDWWTQGRFLVSTDDAYVGADTAVIAPKVSGYVKSVPVSDNTRVTAGTPLLLIDDSDYRIAADQAEAQVAAEQAAIVRIGQQIAAGGAQVTQARAELASAEAGAANAKLEYDRAVALAGKSFGTQQAVDAANAALLQAKAQVDSANAGVSTAEANAAVLAAQKAEAGKTLDQYRLAADKAKLDLEHTVVRAPFDGVIGNRAAEPGEYVQPGERLMARGAAAGHLCRRELQGDAARRAEAGPGGGHLRRRLPGPRHQGDGRKHRAGFRLGLQPAAARQRDRQLHQDRAAARRQDPRPLERRRGRPDPARHVGRGRGRHAHERHRRRVSLTSAASEIRRASAMSSNAIQSDPPIPARRIAAFVAMSVGMFMAILDIQIVASSLSEIQAGVSASADEISWVQTAYLVAEIVMIPLTGFLGRALSTRYLFALASGGFTLMSFMCATATTMDQLIVWRALQGFIGGAMIPSVFAAAYTIFPQSRQGMISAVVGLIATLAPTIGPTAGGYLTNLFSWHWLFLVNVIPGIAVTIATLVLIDFDKPNLKILRQFDTFGVTTLALFLGSLEYVLEEGATKDWFQDRTIVFFFIVSVIAGVAFFARALTAKNPIVDLRTYLDRNFATGSLFIFVIGIGLYGLVYLYPIYLARVRGYDSLQIGDTMFVTGAFMMLTAPISGRIAQRADPRIMIAVGLGLLAVSCLELVPITRDWSFGELFLPQALRGVGLMVAMIPVSMLSLGTLPPDRLKNASGLFNLLRNLGGAVGLAVINTILNDRWDLHIARLHEAVTWSRPAATERLQSMTQHFLSALGSDADMAALQSLATRVRGEALVMAFSDIFLLLALLFFAVLDLRAAGEKAGDAGRRRRRALRGQFVALSVTPARRLGRSSIIHASTGASRPARCRPSAIESAAR